MRYKKVGALLRGKQGVQGGCAHEAGEHLSETCEDRCEKKQQLMG